MLDDILICLRFFSRLPVPVTHREIALGAGGLAAAAAMAPLAGLVVGLCPALVLLLAMWLALPPLVAATLAVATAVISTGALHEDALADCADGFGGGATRERKLEIMRDSRLGTYGACAVTLSLLVRASALAAIAAKDTRVAIAIVLAAAALSRALCLLPLVLLPAARRDGNGAATRPTPTRIAIACALGVAAFALPLALGARPPQTAAAVVAAIVAALAICVVASRQIGGQTGDVAGAVQQMAEIAILVVFSA